MRMRIALFATLCLILCGALFSQKNRGIETVQKADGIFVYTYAETMEEINPRKDYKSIRQVSDTDVIAELKRILKDNSEYTPQFRARCMPVWDIGIEFRAAAASRMYLFSFRCNTVKSVEDNTFKDFTPQRTDLYALLKYEINERTSANLR